MSEHMPFRIKREVPVEGFEDLRPFADGSVDRYGFPGEPSDLCAFIGRAFDSLLNAIMATDRLDVGDISRVARGVSASIDGDALDALSDSWAYEYGLPESINDVVELLASVGATPRYAHQLTGFGWRQSLLESALQGVYPECPCAQTQDIRLRIDARGRVVAFKHCYFCGRNGGAVKRAGHENKPYASTFPGLEWDMLRHVAHKARQDARPPRPQPLPISNWHERHQARINSPEWKALARKIYKRDRYTCQGCLEPDIGDRGMGINCHHITYRNLGAELAHQLTTLCDDCHNKVHFHPPYEANKPESNGQKDWQGWWY